MTEISVYLEQIEKVRKTGAATEHSYRSALEKLLNSVHSDIHAINEPKRVAVGAPDFIVQREQIAIGHVEAKDLIININSFKGENKEQQQRYLKGLPNLIYTNHLDFEFFRDGESVARVSVAKLAGTIQPITANFSTLSNLLKDFASQRPQTITSPQVLAGIMAGKAALIKDILLNTLIEDKKRETELAAQLGAFHEHLIHDITAEDFSDIYAETIAYGLFAARLHDITLDTFSRAEALELLPKSNPFLKNLFSYIAGPNLDDRIKWIIDDLCNAFQACNVRKLMKNFGQLTGRNDPFLHFYETFLSEYNPAKRKARGVWYTPEPVVNFIVRAVDDVLIDEFGLADGLADTSKITINIETGQQQITQKGKFAKSGKSSKVSKEVHRVQILDPATGTGTFLAEVIKQVAPKVKNVAESIWSQYIEKDLIPRLHGFELLMASYAMCHLKLDMILTELKYKPTKTPPRLSVYLTNSLEEGQPANQTLPFAQWLSNEVKQANTIKRDMPIMCVIGNPPYSGISTNIDPWIVNLIDDYKYVDGKHFGERKHWLNDDYVKFIRLGEELIHKNGEGILAFITNHGYLSNPTFRGMRQHLMNTFNVIRIIDLHGNSNKLEVSPDGASDKNVFDIRQGVSIIIALKNPDRTTKTTEVWHMDLWGDRASKYDTLWALKLNSDGFKKLSPRAPYYMFYDVNLEALEKYDAGFSVNDLFLAKSTGIISARDDLTIDKSKIALQAKLDTFLDLGISDDEARTKFFGNRKNGKYLAGDSRGWKLAEKRSVLRKTITSEKLKPILYRPFDERYIAYDPDIVDWPREETMAHFDGASNIALLCPRMTADSFSPLVTNKIVSNKTASRYDQTYFLPLFLDPDPSKLKEPQRSNLDAKIERKLKSIAIKGVKKNISPYDIFDYVYGILHAPSYRELYSEFLSIDFPRIPWPSDSKQFWDIAGKGALLRALHLLDPKALGPIDYPLLGDGDGVVGRPFFEDGRIYINTDQYFDKVSISAWEMSIGGYQPCYKWLKDRKDSELDYKSVQHFQKIIKVMTETDRIMKTIELAIS